jgi:hypothetical protein
MPLGHIPLAHGIHIVEESSMKYDVRPEGDR